jgi:curved DNA-binding protein CbpA
MSTTSDLELQGSLQIHPIAELIAEIACARLNGSLKVSSGDKKAIVYFESGAIKFAVSNERVFRLPEILLAAGVIDRKFLHERSNVNNDLELAEHVISANRLSASDMKDVVSRQCESIIASLIEWTEGEWTYSPHSRVRSDIEYNFDIRRSLIEYSRRLSSDAIVVRFKSMNEWFIANPDVNGIDLQPHEAFVLSRFDGGKLTVGQLVALGGLSQTASMHAVYCLWTGGFLTRHGGNPAFPEHRISQLRAANFQLKKAALETPKAVPKKDPVAPIIRKPEIEPEVEVEPTEFDLEATLSRIESAETYYDVLGLETSAKVAVIRKAYFRLAKQLHPDRYHSESAELLTRIENAFTELAQAHETLKNNDSRQGYDIRMRQAQRDNEAGKTTGAETNRQEGQAAKDFERGFDLQLHGNPDEALPYLARAAHYAPQNARYHAYYGKALSADESQRHKAENEFSTAIRLEPQNDSFRLMLAEFFVRYKLMKRAEGELNRLLAVSPDNRQARALLDSLTIK